MFKSSGRQQSVLQGCFALMSPENNTSKIKLSLSKVPWAEQRVNSFSRITLIPTQSKIKKYDAEVTRVAFKGTFMEDICSTLCRSILLSHLKISTKKKQQVSKWVLTCAP